MLHNFPSLWPIIFAIGVGTFLIRFSFIWLLGRSGAHPKLQKLLKFVPPSVLSALILPSFIFPQQAAFSFENYRMWAGAIAAFIAWKSKNILLTISSGLIALWIISQFGAR